MKTSTKMLFAALALLVAFSFTLGTWGEAFAAKRSPSGTVTITSGKSVDVSFGHAGMYIANPTFNGQASVERIFAKELKAQYAQMIGQRLSNMARFIDVQVLNSAGEQAQNVGVYVYFNLGADTLSMFQQERLGIYHYDEAAKQWVEAPSFLVNFGDYGRITTYTSQLGLYSLMAEPRGR